MTRRAPSVFVLLMLCILASDPSGRMITGVSPGRRAPNAAHTVGVLPGVVPRRVPGALAAQSFRGGRGAGGKDGSVKRTAAARTLSPASQNKLRIKFGASYPILIRQIENFAPDDIAADTAVDNLVVYYDEADPEFRKGMAMILQEPRYATAASAAGVPENSALGLFLFMLDNALFKKGDTVTMAMALVNSELYARGDRQVRQEIRKDIRRHFAFYNRVVEWQRTWSVRYDLSRAPLAPKMFWATRINPTRPKIVNREEYLEFVDRIEHYEEYFDTVIRRTGLEKKQSLFAIA